MKSVAGRGVVGLALLLSVAGCKPSPAVESGRVIGRGSKEPEAAPVVVHQDSTETPITAFDPATLGTVRGIVHFNGKAPAPVKIDTTMDPACHMGGNTAQVFSEQYVVKDGGLANVFVYVKSGPHAAMSMGTASLQPVVLDQKGCQYVPHVIGVVRGGYVQFRNSDVTMHNIHTMPTTVGNETIDVSQGPKGQPQIKQMKAAELMLPVRCNNHPWMNAFINVAPTMFFAVSDATGQFEIKGLPAGDYTLGAVHEKLGEQEIHVVVTAKGVTTGNYAFSMK
jgi:plastocyanin